MKATLKRMMFILKDFLLNTVYGRFIKIYLKQAFDTFFKFVGTHFFYIFWGTLNFYISVLFLGGNSSSFWVSLLLYSASIAVALSPLGEIILRLISHVRPLRTQQEKDYLVPIFEDVYEEVQKAYPNLQKIEICLIDNLTVNACALGTHTIAVTKGALNAFTADELRGVILHEMGHIINGDTKAILITLIGNGIFSIQIVVIKIVLVIIDIFLTPFQRQTGGLTDVFVFLMRILLSLAVFVFTMTGNIILAANSRQHEYNADEFASKMGYGSELISALYLLQKLSLGENMTLSQRLQARHPNISNRIERLEALEAVKGQEQ